MFRNVLPLDHVLGEEADGAALARQKVHPMDYSCYPVQKDHVLDVLFFLEAGLCDLELHVAVEVAPTPALLPTTALETAVDAGDQAEQAVLNIAEFEFFPLLELTLQDLLHFVFVVGIVVHGVIVAIVSLCEILLAVEPLEHGLVLAETLVA